MKTTGYRSKNQPVSRPPTRQSLCRAARKRIWSLVSTRARGIRTTVRRRVREFLRCRKRGFLLRVLRDGAFALAVAGSLLGGGTAAAQAIDLADVAAGDGGFVIEGAGEAVSGAGDVNGDGVPDFIIGAPREDLDGREDAGQSYVVFGKADGAPVTRAAVEAGEGGFVIRGSGAGDRAGTSVSGAGDVDGDGLADVFIGAPGADPQGREDAGASYVVFGKADGTPVELADVEAGTGGFMVAGARPGDGSGFSVSEAGDVDGDGTPDLVVGAPSADPAGREGAGASYVVFGKAGGQAVELAAIAAGDGGFVMRGVHGGDGSGWSVAGAGDVNGDGLADVIVGAPFVDDATENGDAVPSVGASYVVFGKADGTPVELAEVAAGDGGFVVRGSYYSCAIFGREPYCGDGAGFSVSGAGDVNGDGLDDVIVGAPFYGYDGYVPGRSAVVFGKADGTAVELADIAAGEGGFVIRGYYGGYSGWSVSGAGDVDGDGFDDVVVGVPRYAESYVVFGKVDGKPVRLGFYEDNFVISGAGEAVSGAGDVDGDGLADIIIGAPSVPASYVVLSGLRDCNRNGIPDAEDLASGTSADCNQNGLPDDCEADCDADGVPDDCEISSGASADCNQNGLPDECEATPAEARLLGLGMTIPLEPGESVTREIAFTIPAACFLDRGQIQLVLGLGEIALDCIHDAPAPLDEPAAGRVEVTFTAPEEPGEYTLYVLHEEEASCDDALALYTEERARGRQGQAIGTIQVAAHEDVVLDGFLIRGAGSSVSGAGDVNGDGIPDFVVGNDDAASEGYSGVGESYIVFGKSDDAPVELAAVAAGDGGFVIRGTLFCDNDNYGKQCDGGRAGFSVSGAGDVNGDGFDDVIVGAPSAGFLHSLLRIRAGYSYVVFGKRDGAPVDLGAVARRDGGFVMFGISAGDSAGWSVSGAGDVNGDGLDDVIVGAPGAGTRYDPEDFSRLGTRTGESYVVFGQRHGFPVELEDVAGSGGFVMSGISEGDSAGRSVSGAGDVNGDGLDDVIVGAPGAADDAGESYVVFGKSDRAPVDLADIAAGRGGFAVRGGRANDRAGASVSGAGDVNGDGLDDVIVGAPGAAHGAGESYVVFGKSDRTPVDLADIAAGRGGFAVRGGRANGASVSGAGDVDGDGLADVIVGAPRASDSAGESYIVFGKADGASVELDDIRADEGGFAIRGSFAGNRLGSSVSGAGDVNGDGLDDFIIGAPGADASYVVITPRDCNENGISDAEDVASETSEDCNGNGVPDECEADCDGDGTPDDCEISSGESADCDADGIPDGCAISSGASADCNQNDVPDECDATPPALFEAALLGPNTTFRVEPGASVTAEIEFAVATPCFLRPPQLVLGLGASALECIHDGAATTGTRRVEVTITAPVEPGEHTLYVLYEEEASCARALARYSEGRARSGEVHGQLRGRAIGAVIVEEPPRPDPIFRRGDANTDGEVDLSDAIRTLGFLFLGDAGLICRDAADANDDGEVDLSDAVATLGVLFLGNGEIPAPGRNECGVDPTDDDLGCEIPPGSCTQ